MTVEFCDGGARAQHSLPGSPTACASCTARHLALPVPDDSFDHAYSQAALMNISDKRGVFREALRVLRPGGCTGPILGRGRSAGEPYYPLPWATTTAIEFPRHPG